MSFLIRRGALALAAFALAGSAFAADTSEPHSDASFMKDATEAGLAEIQASNMALQQSTNTQVKAFAQQMIDDHTKANAAIAALAQTKGVKLPTEPGVMQKAHLKMLDGAKEATFDKRYAENFGVKAHKDTVKLFQKESQKGKDADAKALAEQTLPTLQHHLEMANDLENTVKAEK